LVLRGLTVNNKYNIFYIFECDVLKQYPYIMKLKSPLEKRYDCKKINKYKEEKNEETDEYMIVKYETEDEGIYFDVKQNEYAC